MSTDPHQDVIAEEGPVERDRAAKDPKRAPILEAAADAFLTYGFRRTSMEDIARAAGLSRPALYLHFRSKEDIFRSLGRLYYERAAAGVAAELVPGRPVAEALTAAFAAQGGEMLAAILASPHGAELTDGRTAGADGDGCEGQERVAAIYAAWLQGEAAAGRVTLAPWDGDAGAVVGLMMAGLYGLKQDRPDYAAYCAARDALARVFARALTP